jgi:phosphoinositide-3-kinase regulatory subunit 4
MIKKMVALDSTSRPTFDVLLHTSRGSVFPEAFYSFLHNYAISINELPGTSAFAPPPPPTGTVSATGTVASSLVKTPGGMSVANADPTVSVLPSDADNRLDRIWSEYESVEPFLESSTPKKAQGAIISESPSGFYAVCDRVCACSKLLILKNQDLFPVELSIPNRDKQILPNADGTFAPEQGGVLSGVFIFIH